MYTSSNATWCSRRHHHDAHKPGFTLVEVLVVIAIIGLLVALTVPAVNIAYRSIKQRSIALECQALANAVEQYRNKFEDYPPDGADPALMERHLRKAFPNIAATEIALLGGGLPVPGGNPPVASANNLPGAVMDPPEALVFFLGGFSDDPAFPLSGRDGPFYITDTNGNQVKSNHPPASIGSIQYNPDRKNALFEFKQSQLTLGVVGGITVSIDDGISGGVNDLLPVYHPPGLTMPYVYFDSRTYQQTTTANVYRTVEHGIVYPYRSAAVNTKYPKATASVPNRNKYFRFVNENSFQLISAGLDDHYGGQARTFYIYHPPTAESSGIASGDSLDLVAAISGAATHPAPQYTRFRDASGGTEQLDNVANFADGTFEDSLSN